MPATRPRARARAPSSPRQQPASAASKDRRSMYPPDRDQRCCTRPSLSAITPDEAFNFIKAGGRALNFSWGLWLQGFQKPDALALGCFDQLIVPHDSVAPDHRADRPAGHLPAVIGCPAGPRRDPVVGNALAALEINHGQVCVVAGGNAALAGNTEYPGRPGAGEIDKACQGKTAG